MVINAATERALDSVAERARDVRMAFTPGAIPSHGDVATSSPSSYACLDPLSASAPADDYFVTTDSHGRTSYTRDGRFALENGALVGSSGRPILGFTEDGAALRELRVDPVDHALGRVSNLRVMADGSVQYDRASVDPRTGKRETQPVSIGRLGLARFPAGTKMISIGDGSNAAPPEVPPHVGRAGDGNFGAIVPMRREESRIDLDRSLERLHDAYIAFDALQAAHKAQGKAGKTVMDLVK